MTLDSRTFADNRARFERLVDLSEAELPLARACLLIAAEEYPNIDTDYYVSRLLQISSLAQQRVSGDLSPCEQISRLNEFLFDELQFYGNIQDYFDPQNSYLNQVLERKTGIPITLSIIYLEIGWHLGIPLVGVGFPGHFLVKHIGNDCEILIDPFGSGKILDEAACRAKLEDLYGEGTKLLPEYFRTATKRQILTRVLSNLKNIYLNDQKTEKALATLELLLILNPRVYSYRRERGLIHQQLECYTAACRDLETYLGCCPEGADAAEVGRQLAQIRRLIN